MSTSSAPRGAIRIHEAGACPRSPCGQAPASWLDTPPATPYDTRVTKPELKWAVLWSVVVMAITAVPYVVMWWYTPLHAFYPWILFNGDDHAVYYAWIRQAHDGHWLFRNLFTLEPQRGIYFHAYFLLLGLLSRAPFLGIEGADQLGRSLFGIITLVLVYRLAAFFTTDVFTRRVVFWISAVSGGFGWLFWHRTVTFLDPVDSWQPEAFTFASLYTNGLFCVSLALMLGIVIALLLAEERGQTRWALAAGACGFLLANIHTYDLFHLTAAWVSFFLVRWLLTRRFPREQLRAACIAAAVTLPSFAYMYWFYKTEPVFSKRVEVPTLTPGPLLYLLGYGLLAPLAIAGGAILARHWRDRREDTPLSGRLLLPLTWCVAGYLVAYAPVAFQRKLVMGLHFPLALLAGLALAELCRRVAKRTGTPLLAGVTAAVVIATSAITMVRFMVRDVQTGLTHNMTSTGIHPVYWDESEIAAFEWLRTHTPASATLMTFPHNGVLAPAYADRAVFAGHWGETPDYAEKMKVAVPFYWGGLDSRTRRRFLEMSGIRYVLDSRLDREYTVASASNPHRYPPPRPLSTEPFLKPVFHQDETTLYEVR